MLTVLSLVLAPIGAAFAQPQPQPPPVRDPLLGVADDYARQKLRFDQTRLTNIRSGLIVPPCYFRFPELDAQLALGAGTTMPIRQAAAAAMVQQNLKRLGIDAARAMAWGDSYYADLLNPPPAQPLVTVAPVGPNLAGLAAPAAGPQSPGAHVHVPHGQMSAATQVSAGSVMAPPPAAVIEAAPPVAQPPTPVPPGAPRSAEDVAGLRLASRINAAPDKPAGFPMIRERGQCGSLMISTPATPYRIRPVPPGGQISYIPLFLFNLCVAQGVQDPYDRTQCKDWKTPDPVSGTPLIGSYMLDGRWGNGLSNQIRRDFNYQGDGLKTVTLGPRP
ncbi:hypothetical protein FHS91_002543 [Sphingobium xanthum]|jgi:hypothetical protein